MLEVSNLVKEYKSLRAVDGLSYTIQPGEIVGLLGPNGAGKTPALRCVAGILRPTFGEIKINGFDLVADQSRAKAGLAFVPEVPSLYELLTVNEHLRFVAMAFNRLDLFEKLGDDLLKRYNLFEKKKALVATLSKGMKQKLALACALIHEANVFLLDEPVIGIDPAGVAQMKAELQRARSEGCAILVSTHLLDTAERLCDRVIIVARGRKLAEGTLAELQAMSGMEGNTLEQVFLKLTEETNEAPVVFDV
ncbi:MAG TPA: ABC transporter ATP-binding protein [Fimbriimonadaceae bacterium]|nr:ABC transporter ATP-binding protein [Fimbriimonadaceae bacterium]